jgi:hypothetical protein
MSTNSKFYRNPSTNTRVCPECLSVHSDQTPHDKDSLYYNCTFYSVHGRWPSWSDAVVQSNQSVRDIWGVGKFTLFRIISRWV